MYIPYHQRRLLRRAERGLRRSDPHLAAMLMIFARLYARETLVSPEQPVRVRAAAWLLSAVVCLAGGVSGAARALSRRVAAAWGAVRDRLGGGQRRAAPAA
jgi:hypothetical protein